MMITRNNYEAYMLDLMDGRLTPTEEAALKLFLEQNPDLDDSIPEINTLESADALFEFKESLIFEEVNEENRSFFFISFTEGLLDNDQEQKMQLFLKKHPEYQKEFEQFQRTFLVAENIKFKNKNTLLFEQEKGFIISFRPLRYIAAAIVLFIFSYATIQLLQNEVTPMYTPTELALEKLIFTPDQKDTLEEDLNNSADLQASPDRYVNLSKKENRQKTPSESDTNKNDYNEKVDSNMAQNENNNEKSNDSIPAVKTGNPPNNDIADNINPIELPTKSTTATKAPTIGELIVKSAKDKLYNNPNAPAKNEFDSELAALASAGISAVSNKEQYINRTVNDSKKTKVSIGGFSFERVKH